MTSARQHRPERIVVGVDGSLNSRAAVRWAIDHAQPGDRVTLVHAWQPSPALSDTDLKPATDDAPGRRFLHHELAHAQALTRAEQVTVDAALVHGDAGDGLRCQPADLVVVGACGHGVVSSLLLGSVSSHLARHCPIPVVIVPCPSRPAEPGAGQ